MSSEQLSPGTRVRVTYEGKVSAIAPHGHLQAGVTRIEDTGGWFHYHADGHYEVEVIEHPLEPGAPYIDANGLIGTYIGGGANGGWYLPGLSLAQPFECMAAPVRQLVPFEEIL